METSSELGSPTGARPMKWLVCGGRAYQDNKFLTEVLSYYSVKVYGIPDLVIAGGAPGADSLAAEWAEDHGIHVAEVLALWDKYGKRAGWVRNKVMLDLGPDVVIAFPGGKGTEMMVSLARQAGVPVRQPVLEGT